MDRGGGLADPALGRLTGATDCTAWNCPRPCTCPADDGYEATALTIGPWDPGLQHAGPPAALLLREAERASGIEGGQTVRLAYDIFAPVPVGPVRVRAAVVRPGRRIELVEAVLDRRRRPAADAPVRLADADTGRTAPARRPEPARRTRRAAGPEDSRPEVAAFFTEDVAYHRALEWRFATGSFNAPGPASAWTRPRCELVDGEPMTPLQHLLVMTDAASGISAALDWNTATFANVDLSRGAAPPAARRVAGHGRARRCSAAPAPPSASPSSSTRTGAIGRSAQSLFVEPR